MACLLLAALIAGVVLPGAARGATPDFNDIGQHWAREDINKFTAKGYIKGYPDGTFRPEQPVTRAEFTTLLVTCLEAQATDRTKTYFSDVKVTHWALGQINEAVRRGILLTVDYPTGLAPDGAIKRSEIAAMVVRALGKTAGSGALPFKDASQIAQSMYRDYIITAYNAGLLSGYPDGEFKPFNTVTRAEACTMLVRFLEKRGTPVVVTPSPDLPAAGTLTTLVAGGKSYDIRTTPVIFKSGSLEIRANRIDTAGTIFFIVNDSRFLLDSATGNPDVIIGNIRYTVKKFTAGGSSLIADTSVQKLYKVTVDGYKYDAEFVKLYIGNRNSDLFLSDAELAGEYSLKIDGRTYDLSKDKITIAVRDQFYRVKRIISDENETRLNLVETDPVVIDKPDMSDITAIFVGSRTLDLTRIRSMSLIIDGKTYRFSEISLDAEGSFVVRDRTYPVKEVTMIIDQEYYKIDSAQVYKGKFIFYCTESDVESWVEIDGKCRPASDVQILKDGSFYSLDEALVVKRNVLRIKNRQYNVDSSIKCRFDGKVYDIEEIDFDTVSNMVTLEVKEATGYWGSQPVNCVFYLNDRVYQRGISEGDALYTGGRWRDFSSIAIVDPARYTYDNSTYDLIGARLRLDDEEFKIYDTVWRGRTETLEIHLEER